MKTNNLKYSATKIVNNEVIKVDIRLNDECKNGHQDFAITGEVYQAGKPRIDKYLITCGCIHDDILKHFPEFKIFIDLHLCDCAGIPMYAVENGFYHLRNGFNEVKPFEDEFEQKFCEYYRIKPKQFEQLDKSENKIEYAILLKDLGVLKQWNDQAEKAIKLLEELTGDEFINDSKKSQYNCPEIDQIKDFQKKKEEGYYSLENKKKREAERVKKEKNETLQKIIDSAQKDINKATEERDVKLFLIKRIIKLSEKTLNKGFRLNHLFENYIYYNHTKTLSFNWLDYKDKMSEKDFDIICNSLNEEDFNKLPTNICFELKGVKKFTNK